jgi:hypothetical protein
MILYRGENYKSKEETAPHNPKKDGKSAIKALATHGQTADNNGYISR